MLASIHKLLVLTVSTILVGEIFFVSYPAQALTSSSPLIQPSSNPSVNQDLPDIIPLSLYGYSDSIRLSGASAKTIISIPVYPGLSAKYLRVQLVSTPNITDGFVSFEHDNATFFSTPLPAPSDAVLIPLRGIKSKNDRIDITINGVFSTQDETCSAFRSRWIDVTNLGVALDGTPVPPTTISEFFSPTLNHINLFVGQNPTPKTIATALKITALAQKAAVTKALDVTIESSPLQNIALKNDPYTRTISLVNGTENSLKLVPTATGWPYLLVSTIADEWQTVTKPLFDVRTNGLLQVDTLSVQAADRLTTTIPSTISFDQLGTSLIRLQGAGEMHGSLSFSQTAFSRLISDATLHLKGQTSVLQKDGVARLDTYFNNTLVDSFAPSERGGSFDRTIPLSNDDLRRDNQFDFALTYTPPGGNCRVGLHNMALDIIGTSTISATSSPLFAPSFDHFPQIIQPTFNLVLDTPNNDTLTAAARLIVLWQRLSPTLLNPHISFLSSFKPDLTPTVILTNNSSRLPPLQAFIDPEKFNIREVGLTEIMDTPKSFAVMQTFLRDETPYLVISPHAWDSGGVRSPLDFLLSKEGWYEAKGNVLITTREGKFGFAELDQLKKVPRKYGAWGTGTALTEQEKLRYGLIAAGIFITITIVAALLGLTYKKRQKKFVNKQL